MRGKTKKLIAGFLAVVMAVTAVPALPAKASQTYEETFVYDLELMKEEILNSKEAEGYRKGAVTFPSSAAQMNMGQELIYHLFRQGNTDKEQTVTIATQDISAGYGKNYEVIVDGKVIKGKSKVVLDGKGVTYDVYLDEGNAAFEGDGTEEEQSVNLDAVRENASSMFDITFAPGEQVKEIRVRAKTPVVAENHKEFQFVILECSNGLETGAYPCTAITMLETRELEEAVVEMVEGSQEVIDGYLTFEVERSGNIHGYTSYDLSAEDGTAVNGENYILDSTQLIFSPGVSKQRVHVPLVAEADGQEKTLTIAVADSETEVSYETTASGAASKTFKKQRNLIDIPMDQFVLSNYNSSIISKGDIVLEEDSDDSTRYIFGFYTPPGSSKTRNASIRTKEQYDFTGVKSIKLAASYRPGTVAGDFLNVYVSNEDYYSNEAMLGNLKAKGIGGSMDILELTGKTLHEFSLDRTGDYYVYFTAEQHSGTGWIYYNIYNQDFGSGENGHVALVLKPFKLEAVNPSGLSGGVPAMDTKLTLTTDSKVTGKNISEAYRGESFTITYNQTDDAAIFAGYELVDSTGKAYHTVKTNSPVFQLTSDIIKSYSHKFTDDTIRVRPLFQYKQAEVDILTQDFEAAGMDNISAYIDTEAAKAVYTDNGTEIATITWDNTSFDMGFDLNFTVKENPSYLGEYRFTAFKEEWGSSKTGVLSNPVYHADPKWSVNLEKNYYAITPIISNRNAKLLLNVSGASHGLFKDKPEGFTGDTYTVESYNGNYSANDIVTFEAKPDEGYRAKWSYRDVATGDTKVYYGSMFYYRVQVPLLATDNHVKLEFEKCTASKPYNVVADVFMQGGNVLHEPDEDTEEYTPLAGSWVSLEATTKETGSDGSTDIFTVNGRPGEVYTALVTANKRYYIQEVQIPADASQTNFRQEMKISYYYEGPRVTSVHYYDYDSVPQSGDVIYLEDETSSVIVGASIETAGADVTDVLFKIKDSTGAVKGSSYVGSRNGNEYIWSAQLGLLAAEGDEIWIELVKREYDGDTVISEVSYGEYNTGYSIVIAEFMDTTYIPDTGFYHDFESVPVFGDMYFLLGKWGMRPPTISVSKTSGILYLTIGLNFGGGYNFLKDNTGHMKGWDVTGSWNDYKETVKSITKVFGTKAGSNERIAATQMLKRHNFSIDLCIGAQLALYDYTDSETKQSNLMCIGAFLTFGFSGCYSFTIPIMLKGIPAFVTGGVSGSFGDTIEIYSKDPEGATPVQNMHDRTHSAYKPSNDLVFTLTPNLAFGVGVNGILDFAGGGEGAFNFEWVDWSYGTGTLSVNVIFQLELLVFGGKAHIDVDDYVLFNNSPYGDEVDEVQSGSRQAEESLLNEKLSDYSVKPLDGYSQKINSVASTKTGMAADKNLLVSDAYEFTRPNIYSLGDDRYMILAAVDKKLVEFAPEENGEPVEGDNPAAVLAYAIYNANTNTYEDVENGKVFHSLLPESEVGNSIDFHPTVVEIGDTNKYVIIWNKILYDGNEENLTLANTRTAIQAVVYDRNTGDYEYTSLVSEDDDNQIMSSVVLNAVYDEDANEVVVLYRSLNQNNLTEDSTLRDYARVGTSLMTASIKSDGNGGYEFTESTSLVSGGVENEVATIIKTADLAMMNGDPYVTYNITEGTQANLLSDAEEGSTNDIYLAKLSHISSGGYQLEATKKVTEDSSEEYNIAPRLASGEVAGETVNVLMWKQEGRMATLNVTDYFEQGENYVPNGVANILNDVAGSMDDFQMLKGENGKIYAIWTEVTETGVGTKVMMAALEDIESREDKVISWGEGSEIFETADNIFVKALSPVVDSEGNLHLLYREQDLKTGYSSIVLYHKNIEKDELMLANYIELSDEELEDIEGADQLANLRLHISNRRPKAGEEIVVTGRVENEGATVTEKQTLELYADGVATGQTVQVNPLNSGEGEEFEISYVVPEDFGQTSETMELSVRGSNAYGSLSETVISGPALSISNVEYEQMTYPDFTDENETVSFKIRTAVTNIGNEPAEEHFLTVSNIEQGKDESGKDTYLEDLFGEVSVPEIEPEETAIVETVVEIPVKYFNNNIFKLGSVAFALYETTDEGERNMVDGAEDYLKAEEAPKVAMLRTSESKKVGVGQTMNLKTKVEPANAQILAELSYSSSDESIAVVDENGFVTGVKEGVCTITVTAANGVSKTIMVTVTKEEVSDEDSEDPIVDPDNPSTNHPSADKPESGKTGDTANIMLWMLLLILSCGSVCIVRYRKKKGE